MTAIEILENLTGQGLEVRVGPHEDIEGFYVELVLDGDQPEEWDGPWEDCAHGKTVELALLEAQQMWSDPDYVHLSPREFMGLK
jgi:hypothetical protein